MIVSILRDITINIMAINCGNCTNIKTKLMEQMALMATLRRAYSTIVVSPYL